MSQHHKPNILFIMTDQQHDKMMSCANGVKVKTPELDRLASEGVRFEQAYCTNPVCVPSRISMATGLMPGRCGVFENSQLHSDKVLEPYIFNNSMGFVMKSAGYDTFYGGKAHLGKHLSPGLNTGYNAVNLNDREDLPKNVLGFINQKRKNPFFAVASFINPHDICFAHRASKSIDTSGVLKLYREASDLPDSELPPLPNNYELPLDEALGVNELTSTTAVTPSKLMREEYSARDWRIYRWIYRRLTEQVDMLIGEILRGLKEAKLEDNTLIIFTSDHGNMDGAHRLSSKSFAYEESVRVPLILKYNNHILQGQLEKNHLVSIGLDILPTIMDYAGIEKPKHLLGESLRPICELKKGTKYREFVVCENHAFRMVRSECYKYCVYNDPSQSESLIDLKNDPGEMKNLIQEQKYSKIIEQHRAHLKNWVVFSKDQEGKRFL